MSGYTHYAVANSAGSGSGWAVVRIADSGTGHSVVAFTGTTQEATRIANGLNALP